MLCAQAWKPGSQHAGEKRGVAGLLLGRTERAARAAELQLCAQARYYLVGTEDIAVFKPFSKCGHSLDGISNTRTMSEMQIWGPHSRFIQQETVEFALGNLCFINPSDDCAEKAMAPHSSTLAWKIPWTEEPGRLQSMGSHRVGHD